MHLLRRTIATMLAMFATMNTVPGTDDPVPGNCPAPRSCGDRDYWLPYELFEIEAAPKSGQPTTPVWSRPPCGVTDQQALLAHAKSELLRTFDVWVKDQTDIDWHEEVLQDWDVRECACVTIHDGSGEHNTYNAQPGLDVRVVSGPDWDRSGPQDVLIEVHDHWGPDDGAKDSPAQITVRVEVAVCDWSVTAKFETRIDCLYIGAPAATFTDFFNGGIKTEQSITFQPLLPCHQSWSRYNLDGTVDGVSSVRLVGTPDQRYGSTAGYAGFRAPVNNCPPCVNVPSVVALRPVCRTTLPRDRNTWITMNGSPSSVSGATFRVSAANPCVDDAPPIDAEVSFYVRKIQAPGGPLIGLEARADGWHDRFPTHELKVNGLTLHLAPHCPMGSTPADLFEFMPKIEFGFNSVTWVRVR